MKTDMHFHSTVSDGNSTKEELVTRALELGVDFLALTDHDVVSYGFRDMCREKGILSCESVEISARNEEYNKSLHLTFYAQTINKQISDVLTSTVIAKTGLIEKQVKFFNSIGFDINLDDLYLHYELQGRKRNALNKFDIVAFMYRFPKNVEKATEINEGVPISIEAFFQKFLKKDGSGFNKYAVIIDNYEVLVSECGIFRKQVDGILSIAHPNNTFKKGIVEFETVLPNYVDNGVNAIEINSKATREWIEAILKAKDKYGLYLTFGSDNHKIGRTDSKHGEFGSINSQFTSDEILSYLGEYREKII